MSEVDNNGDGLLSLKEFKDMMLRLIWEYLEIKINL